MEGATTWQRPLCCLFQIKVLNRSMSVRLCVTRGLSYLSFTLKVTEPLEPPAIAPE